MRVGFIGAGKMASAMCKGFIQAGMYKISVPMNAIVQIGHIIHVNTLYTYIMYTYIVGGLGS